MFTNNTRGGAFRTLSNEDLCAVAGGGAVGDAAARAQAISEAKATADAMTAILKKYGLI